MILLEIPQDPASWSATHVGRSKSGTYDPKYEQKKVARWHIKMQYKGPLIEDYVGLVLELVFPFPKSASKKALERMRGLKDFPTRKDNTNCQKLYEDCLKGIVLKDDRYVVYNLTTKKYGPVGLVKIKVTPICTSGGDISLC